MRHDRRRGEVADRSHGPDAIRGNGHRSSPSERTLLLRVRWLTDVSRCNRQQNWPYLRLTEVRLLRTFVRRIKFLSPCPACRAAGPGPFFYSPGCDRACCHRSLPRRHRPVRHAPVRRAGRPPRAAAPEHRHRCGDRAARRGRRPGRAPGRCAVPAAAPGPACSRRRVRAAVLITAHARTVELVDHAENMETAADAVAPAGRPVKSSG